jgi:hypothetical protein
VPRDREDRRVIAAIMQPYFFPYIGYFQLMNAVDVFVFYDDAQYMKGGWINRNRILVNGEPAWLTLPIRSASIKLSISQRHYLFASDAADTIKRRLRTCYEKAPAFDAIYPFLCELLDYEDSNIAAFNSNLLTALAGKLGIACTFLSSSSINKRTDIKGQDRVIDICRRIGADRYINPIGGVMLYDNAAFSEEGIQLRFLQTNPSVYPQFGAAPQPFLSIIDVLMFNSIERTRTMLDDYHLVMPEKVSPR